MRIWEVVALGLFGGTAVLWALYWSRITDPRARLAWVVFPIVWVCAAIWLVMLALSLREFERTLL
jgi:hypothetical protein